MSVNHYVQPQPGHTFHDPVSSQFESESAPGRHPMNPRSGDAGVRNELVKVSTQTAATGPKIGRGAPEAPAWPDGDSGNADLTGPKIGRGMQESTADDRAGLKIGRGIDETAAPADDVQQGSTSRGGC